jgi:DNA-binding CsgD family transcriptional regulator
MFLKKQIRHDPNMIATERSANIESIYSYEIEGVRWGTAESSFFPFILREDGEERASLFAQIEAVITTTFSLREAEVFALSCCGMSSKHIGGLLGRSHRTIETHLSRCYQKLGCYGKQHAIDLMHENGALILWLDLGKNLLQSHFSKNAY